MTEQTRRCRVITLDEAKAKGLDPFDDMWILRIAYQMELAGIETDATYDGYDKHGNWYSSDDFKGFVIREDFLEFLE